MWALLPLVTGGLATPWCFLYAGVRTRLPRHLVAAVVYLLIGVGAFVVLGNVGDTNPLSDVAVAALLLPWLGGFVHALIVRKSIFDRSAEQDNARAVAAVGVRRERRREARALAQSDPSAAAELRIGRPDLPRDGYDDGGLVDVNHAPAETLVRVLEITPDQAATLVRAREAIGGYVSAEDVSANTDLPVRLVPRLAEYGVFLP